MADSYNIPTQPLHLPLAENAFKTENITIIYKTNEILIAKGPLQVMFLLFLSQLVNKILHSFNNAFNLINYAIL